MNPCDISEPEHSYVYLNTGVESVILLLPEYCYTQVSIHLLPVWMWRLLSPLLLTSFPLNTQICVPPFYLTLFWIQLSGKSHQQLLGGGGACSCPQAGRLTLTSSVGDVAAQELLPLPPMHQSGTLEQQGRRQDVAGDGGEDVDGGAHGWRLGGGAAGRTDGRTDGGFLFKVPLEL